MTRDGKPSQSVAIDTDCDSVATDRLGVLGYQLLVELDIRWLVAGTALTAREPSPLLGSPCRQILRTATTRGDARLGKRRHVLSVQVPSDVLDQEVERDE